MALSTERWWIREIEPPNLAALTEDLRTHYGVTRSLIGCKGDENHLRGYHRSREWILNSEYSRDGASDYSVTSALDKTGDARWLSAMDFQTKGGVPELIEVCKRLDAAVKADRLPQIREWYGNADGDKVVDGWDNLRDRAASSDTSHLWHLHISFFRSRANWDHSLLYKILTGVMDMSVLVIVDGDPRVWLSNGITRRWVSSPAELTAIKAARTWLGLVDTIVHKVASLDPYGVDVASLVAAPPTLALTAEDRAAIAADVAAALVDRLGEREAAADRARADVLDGA